jgi:ubiquinone/menaquinone biosynthesis C-methylase UbiE
LHSTSKYGVDKDTAQSFADYMRKYPELYTAVADILAEQLWKKNPVILDVGMGPGLLEDVISRKVPGASIIGIDPVDQMVQLAARESRGRFSVIQGISENLPLCDYIIDVVVSRFSLPYWSDPQQSFNEMFRVLCPQGFVILDILNKEYSKVKLNLIKLRMYMHGAAGTVVRYHQDAYRSAYCFNEVCHMLEEAGFSVITQMDTTFDWHIMIKAQK